MNLTQGEIKQHAMTISAVARWLLWSKSEVPLLAQQVGYTLKSGRRQRSAHVQGKKFRPRPRATFLGQMNQF